MRADPVVLALLATLATAAAAGATDYGLGRPASPDDIAAWNIDVAPDGSGLPPGSGSVQQGQQLFADSCAACHGAHGEGKPMDALAGGAGTLANAKPVKTVGSFWPYATTLYDFVHRAMPFNAPQTLSPDQTYAVVAYVLYLNRIVPADAVMDARTLPAVVMPARERFKSGYETRKVSDPSP